MKFAHLGDCHLGGWRQPELRDLNFLHFQEALRICISERVEFILIAGDLFDSAYPPIETLKETFNEFRKVKEANIPVFLIAGSHDYSVSGKTFLDVLENAGFCKNAHIAEEKEGKIILSPIIHHGYAIYGYPGKKSGLEVDEIERIKIHDAPGLFKILMLHTTIRDAIGNLPIKAVDERKLPKVDYLALAHLHINYMKENRVYCGPLFPNNIMELEELGGGSFYIYDNGRLRKQSLIFKKVLPISLEVKNTLTFTHDFLNKIKDLEIKDKIVILRLYGDLEQGKTSDIDFTRIETELKKKKAYAFLKNTSKLNAVEGKAEIKLGDSDSLESDLIKKFEDKNGSKYYHLVNDLMRVLGTEKLEDEKNVVFEERLLSELNVILKNEI